MTDLERFKRRTAALDLTAVEVRRFRREVEAQLQRLPLCECAAATQARTVALHGGGVREVSDAEHEAMDAIHSQANCESDR